MKYDCKDMITSLILNPLRESITFPILKVKESV